MGPQLAGPLPEGTTTTYVNVKIHSAVTRNWVRLRQILGLRGHSYKLGCAYTSGAQCNSTCSKLGSFMPILQITSSSSRRDHSVTVGGDFGSLRAVCLVKRLEPDSLLAFISLCTVCIYSFIHIHSNFHFRQWGPLTTRVWANAQHDMPCRT